MTSNGSKVIFALNQNGMVIQCERELPMTIDLSPELEKFVQQQVQTGRFASPSAAVNAAVEWMQR